MISWIGADVSKDYIAMFVDGRRSNVANEPRALKKFFGKYDAQASLVIEGSGGYCRKPIEAALGRNLTIYAVNPADFRSYAESLNYRAKTDPIDAELLARYGQKECDRLRVYQPPSQEAERARALLGLRDLMIKGRSALSVAFVAMPDFIQSDTHWLLADLTHTGEQIQKNEQQLAAYVGSRPVARTLLQIPGIGILTATALDWVFDRCQFSNSDQLVAFVGLDVRVRDSGRHKGARKLTKRGDALVRKLCIQAAHSLRRSPAWRGLFAAYSGRGLSVPAVNAIIARKLLRIAFALITTGQAYDPRKVGGLLAEFHAPKQIRLAMKSPCLPPCLRRFTKTPSKRTKISAPLLT